MPTTGEEYLQESNPSVAYTGDEMEALQAASSAVSRMVSQDVSLLPSTVCLQFGGAVFVPLS